MGEQALASWAALFRAVVPALWVAVAAASLCAFYRPVVAGLGRLTNLDAFGVKLAMAALAVEQAVELAEKNARWTAQVPARARAEALARAQRDRALLRNADILWVDDRPGNNRNEWRMFTALGAIVSAAATTDEALELLAGTRMGGQRPVDMVVSDMARGENPAAGLEMLARFAEQGERLPVIFYVGSFDAARGIPPGCFAMTDRPDQLLHAVLDVMARARPDTKTGES